ncbi:coiled-coil domain-containing protein 150-like isoform X2 [Acanthaster planci]|uniref:Coiled-coil domain-containing protein 150-like isoform X2 n=1 Tax=Acanthaster planci TaxID=133434 RepID=A0A8B7ZCV2_ACAPL|nr:coiled-coil domain-containing protein 150-like isoform X2 [Acanthaster planci]
MREIRSPAEIESTNITQEEGCLEPSMDDQQTEDEQVSSATMDEQQGHQDSLTHKVPEYDGEKTEDQSKETLVSRLDILQFQNKFYECIEELKIRRAIDAENEERINQLVSTQHDHQRAIKEEIAKNSALSERHSQELRELERQQEEKIHQLQAEKKKLTLAAEAWEKEMEAIKDDIRTLQLTKYSLEKTIKDQDQRLQMQGSARSSHLSKMTELEALGREAGKQCGAVAGQLKHLEADVQAAQKLNGRLSFINQHQTCTIRSLEVDLKQKTQEIVSLRAQLDEKPTREESDLKAVQSQQKQTEKHLKQSKNTCELLSIQIEEARLANQNLLESLARSQKLSERHLVSSNENAERASSLATDVKNLETEIGQFKDELLTKQMELKAEKQKNEKLAANFSIQEGSLRGQLASLQEEKRSLVEAQKTLEEMNSSWSRKNTEMNEIIRELKERITESEKREEDTRKENKSTNTEAEQWQQKADAAERRLASEEIDQSHHVTGLSQDGKASSTDETNNQVPQRKASDEPSKTAKEASWDHVSMQIEASTTEQAPCSAPSDQLESRILIKDAAPGLRQAEGNQGNNEDEGRVIHDSLGGLMETEKSCPSSDSDKSNSNCNVSESRFTSNSGSDTETVNVRQENEAELMQYPKSPLERVDEKENQPSQNSVTPAKSDLDASLAGQAVSENKSLSPVGIDPKCPPEANSGTNIHTGTDEVANAVNMVDFSDKPTKHLDPERDANQVVLLDAPFQIPTSEDLQQKELSQKLINQPLADGSLDALQIQPTKKEITEQGLREKSLTTSAHGSKIAQETGRQDFKLASIPYARDVQDTTQRQPTSGLGRFNIANTLSVQQTSSDQVSKSKIQASGTYLNEGVRTGTRSSYMLPGLALLASQPRYGLTPRANLSASMLLRPIISPGRTEHIPDPIHSKVTEKVLFQRNARIATILQASVRPPKKKRPARSGQILLRSLTWHQHQIRPLC